VGRGATIGPVREAARASRSRAPNHPRASWAPHARRSASNSRTADSAASSMLPAPCTAAKQGRAVKRDCGHARVGDESM